jgi:hypothetical protein
MNKNAGLIIFVTVVAFMMIAVVSMKRSDPLGHELPKPLHAETEPSHTPEDATAAPKPKFGFPTKSSMGITNPPTDRPEEESVLVPHGLRQQPLIQEPTLAQAHHLNLSAQTTSNSICSDNRVKSQFPNQRQWLADWGKTNVAPLCPIKSKVDTPAAVQQEEWCSFEKRVQVKDRQPDFEPFLDCEYEPFRIGNITSINDLTMYTKGFPSLENRGFPAAEQITNAMRERYFSAFPSGVDPQCHICKGTMVQPVLYSLRRWWRVSSWKKFDAASTTEPGEASDCNVLILDRGQLACYANTLAWNEPTADDAGAKEIIRIPVGKDSAKESQDESPITPQSPNGTVTIVSTLKRILWCLPPTPPELGPDAGRADQAYVLIQTSKATHKVRFAYPTPGANCLYRSLLLLLPGVAKSFAQVLPSDTCATLQLSALEPSYPMPPRPAKLPYLPCYVFRLTEKMKIAQKLGNIDQYKNYWPMKCEAQREVSPECGTAVTPRPIKEPLRVAITFSGFLRFYEDAKKYIEPLLIKPNNAELFASTWNLVGRIKKFQPITKKNIVTERKMRQIVMSLFNQTNTSASRVEVLNYHFYMKKFATLEQNGFPQTGLYYTLSRSLKMVELSGLTFDIVVRTRFDIYPSVPLTFLPVRYSVGTKDSSKSAKGSEDSSAPTEDGWMLDVGSSCQLQGAWFPQRVVLRPGHVLKHYADTRFKLIGWQVCDWMEIGDYSSMMKIGNQFDWLIENNVFSSSQWMEHVFHVDQGIPYLPVNLFLKIMRFPKKLFG